MGDYDINTDSDDTYTSNLNGKTYMAAVSPWFFTVSITCQPNKQVNSRHFPHTLALPPSLV